MQAVGSNVQVVPKYNAHLGGGSHSTPGQLQTSTARALMTIIAPPADYTGALWYLLRLDYGFKNV